MGAGDDGRAGEGEAFAAWDAERDGLSMLPLRLVRPITWERDVERDLVRIHLDAWDQASLHRPGVVAYLEALERVRTLPDLVDDVMAEAPERPRPGVATLARQLVTMFMRQGNVEIRLPPVPAVFDDRFERVEELGRGAVGVVWRCRDLDDGGEPVAVKHAWNWVRTFADADRRVRDEADVLARLHHDGIVALRAAFDVEGRAHFARDFVDGQELHDVVHREGPPPARERARLLGSVGSALGHMHERGVLHLDLSPTNIMLTRGDQRPVFSDLDLAVVATAPGRAQLSGQRGSPGYAAPEVRREPHEATVASDVYGLGRLAWFLGTGGRPDPRKDHAELVDRLKAAGATAGEVALFEACCRDEPERRPASVEDALAGLDGSGPGP